MPNTLAHIGAQTLLTGGALGRGARTADLKWIWLGGAAPDFPWIAQRAAKALWPDAPLYDIRLYAVAQASLLVCLIFAVAAATVAARPLRAFALLASGAILHLVLDALQTKWGNGVEPLAPLRWTEINVGLFWPESPITLALTAAGFFVGVAGLALALRDLRRGAPTDLVAPSRRRALVAALALAAYAAAPAAMMGGAERFDAHYVGTLRDVGARPGRAVAFDRAHATAPDRFVTFAGETLALTAPPSLEPPEPGAVVSARGVFSDPSTVSAVALHVHRPGLRDGASYIGLALTAVIWAAAAIGAARGGGPPAVARRSSASVTLSSLSRRRGSSDGSRETRSPPPSGDRPS